MNNITKNKNLTLILLYILFTFPEIVMIETLKWINNTLRVLDQTKLPLSEEYIFLNNLDSILEAIKALKIRGAPALGIVGAYGMATGLKEYNSSNENFSNYVKKTAERIIATRPTAINLSWGVNRIKRLIDANSNLSHEEIYEMALLECRKIQEEDIAICKRIGRNGSELIRSGMHLLTHCNTGGLATGGFGTALGVIETAVSDGKQVHVFVDETRPLLQGARLTAWELCKNRIPYTLICDNMAGYFIQQGKIDAVILGADRITRYGDVANKIGTYTLAVLCEKHTIPFYVAAPTSTLDLSIAKPEDITIEFRDAKEIRQFRSEWFTLSDAPALNPAFDVTPRNLVTAIITEQGVYYGPDYDFLNIHHLN